ncbi:MAG TPA: hypothetical protein VM580_27130 [Labilithrix sp.]|nr:hypothetical protein [Labilithrix sp.]
MKSRHLLSALSCIVAASAAACSVEPNQQPANEESTATSEQNLVSTAGNIFIWPAGPISWNGMIGTWPISVWSPTPIGGLAFDTMGATLLGVSLANAPMLGPAIRPAPITAPFLNALVPPVGVPLVPPPAFGPMGLVPTNFGFAGTFNPFIPANPAFAFGAFAPNLGLTQATVLDGVVTPGFNTWLAPSLTSSALMFNSLAAMDAMTPLTFNVTFQATRAAQTNMMMASQASIMASTTAAQAANLASLSIFAAPLASAALTTAAMPFTSIAFPVTLPAVPVGAVVPPFATAVGF